MGISLYESQLERLFDGTRADGRRGPRRTAGRSPSIGDVDGSAERYWVSGRV